MTPVQNTHSAMSLWRVQLTVINNSQHDRHLTNCRNDGSDDWWRFKAAIFGELHVSQTFGTMFHPSCSFNFFLSVAVPDYRNLWICCNQCIYMHVNTRRTKQTHEIRRQTGWRDADDKRRRGREEEQLKEGLSMKMIKLMVGAYLLFSMTSCSMSYKTSRGWAAREGRGGRSSQSYWSEQRQSAASFWWRNMLLTSE